MMDISSPSGVESKEPRDTGAHRPDSSALREAETEAAKQRPRMRVKKCPGSLQTVAGLKSVPVIELLY